MGSYQYDMDTYGKETEGWIESQTKYDGHREELDKQIETSMDIQNLRDKLGEWEGDKEWKGRREMSVRKE